MEEVLAIIIQIVLEVGLQIFGSIGFDFATESRRKHAKDGETQEQDGCGWLVLFAVFGGICGGLSLILFSKPLLPNAGVRIANLLAAPLIAGGLSYLIAARVWAPRGQSASHHGWRGFWFALAFGLVRFAYMHR